ncbi:MAG: hypothetical protein U9O20_03680 [Patescibacteria group bacterium]|nr:hypothetical protein [Patescibacteria group bacterium]
MKKVKIAMFFAVVLVLVTIDNAFTERNVNDAVSWAENQFSSTQWYIPAFFLLKNIHRIDLLQ